MGIDQYYDIYKIHLLNLIQQYDVYTTGRRNSQKMEVYIDIIFTVLNTGISWNKLNGEIKGDTVKRKYYKWLKLNIFKMLHANILNNYIENNNIINTYVDSTDVANVNGKLDFGYSYKIKNKKSLRITCIIDDNYSPLLVHYNKSSMHDTKIINEIIDNNRMNLHATYHKPIHMAADKGYISAEIKQKLKKQHIIYITPCKRNQKKKKHKLKHVNCLKNRFKVEHFFSILKRNFKRIVNIVDRCTKSYDSFLLISMSILIIRSAHTP